MLQVFVCNLRRVKLINSFIAQICNLYRVKLSFFLLFFIPGRIIAIFIAKTSPRSYDMQFSAFNPKNQALHQEMAKYS